LCRYTSGGRVGSGDSWGRHNDALSVGDGWDVLAVIQKGEVSDWLWTKVQKINRRMPNEFRGREKGAPK
jgi:hypothetical protein